MRVKKSAGTVLLIGTAIAVSTAWMMQVSTPARAQGIVTLDHAVRNCRLISNKDARLACYDSVIDEANSSLAPQSPPAASASPVPPAPVAQAAPPAPPKLAKTDMADVRPPSPPAPPIVSQPAAQPAVVASTPAPAKRSGSAKPTGDALEIASAKWAGGGVEITMRDGTVWRQVDSTDMQTLPKAGEKLSITSGIFGKHLCQYGAEPLFDCRQK